MSRSHTSSQAVEQLIGAGCSRNAPAELLYEGRDGTVVVGRVRLLELTPRRILADRPVCLESDGTIPIGAPITVHVNLQGTRHQFESVIEDGDQTVQLNSRQTIPGIAMRKPAVVMESQRRAHLRISVVAYDPTSVTMARPHPNLADACAVDASIITGWLVDLSVGGISVLVDRGVLESARLTERFFLTFALPAMEGEFNMLGSVRHCRVVGSSNSLRLGIGFRPWRGPAFRRDQRRISQFVTEHERRLLRRRK